MIYVEDFDTIKLLNEGVVHVLGRGLSTSWRIAWQILKNETHAYFLCMGLFYFKEKGIWYELFIEIFLIGVGLSMDAFAVSIVKAYQCKK